MALVVRDRLIGIDKASTQVFNGIPHQKCVVHLQGNLQSYVAHVRWAVMDVDDPSHRLDDAVKEVKHLSAKWPKKYPAFGKYIVKMEWEHYLKFLNHHIKIRRMMYTTNQVEDFNKSAGKTLKIRGAFPDEESVLALNTNTAIDKREKSYK